MRMKQEWLREKEERHRIICQGLGVEERIKKMSWDILYRLFMKYPEIAQRPQIQTIISSPKSSEEFQKKGNTPLNTTEAELTLAHPAISNFHIGRPIAPARDVS